MITTETTMRKELSTSRRSMPASKVPFHVYLARQIDLSEKTQREIAEAMGYTRPNLITMFKQGSTKVPIEKVPALARVLGLEPTHLLTLAMREYMPTVLQAMQETFGYSVTDNEFDIVEAIRDVTHNANPRLRREQKSRLKDVFA